MTGPAVLSDDSVADSVVIQGEWITTVPGLYRITYLGDDDPSGPIEAWVRVPADVLRRSVLADVLAYEVTIDGKAHAFAPQDVRVMFLAPAGGPAVRAG